MLAGRALKREDERRESKGGQQCSGQRRRIPTHEGLHAKRPSHGEEYLKKEGSGLNQFGGVVYSTELPAGPVSK